MSRPTFDELGMATAKLWSRRSADNKVQVGCAILDHYNRLVGVGYNGRAAGEPNERESEAHGMSGFIHAEVNALLAANWNGDQHTLYCTHSPCSDCARLIINSRRIKRVVYAAPYHQPNRAYAQLPTGIDILRNAGIDIVEAVSDEDNS